MDEDDLLRKLQAIEALYAGAATPGEREAADLARDRIRARLRQCEREDPAVEYRFSIGDPWSRKLFFALLRRYDIRPYRYPRQRRTTVMARVSRRFVDETLWPAFEAYSAELHTWLDDITEDVIRRALHEDSSDAEVVNRPRLA